MIEEYNYSFTRLPLLRVPDIPFREACRGHQINVCEAKNARLKRVEIPVNDSRASEIYRLSVCEFQHALIIQPMYRNL